MADRDLDDREAAVFDDVYWAVRANWMIQTGVLVQPLINLLCELGRHDEADRAV